MSHNDTRVPTNCSRFLSIESNETSQRRTAVDPPSYRSRNGPPRRNRNWCFTWNNPPDSADQQLADAFTSGGLSFVCYQHEVGTSTGTPHIQGYLEAANPRTLGGIKTAIGTDHIHLETRRGTAQEAADYCKKPGGTGYTEYGNIRPGQGSRSDLNAVREDIIAGTLNELELVDAHFSAYAKYHRFFAMYRELRRRYTEDPSYSKKHVVYYGGSTGTGKTAKALHVLSNQFPGYAIYIRPSTTGSVAWFPGLSVEHRGMIIDEFRSDISLTVMLRLLDGYPYQVETKGGFIDTRYLQVIIITSNYMPWELYPKTEEKYKKPLYRRIDECYWFEKGINECPMPWNRTNELKALI